MPRPVAGGTARGVRVVINDEQGHVGAGALPLMEKAAGAGGVDTRRRHQSHSVSEMFRRKARRRAVVGIRQKA